jgi:hypothetical protein
MAGRSAHGQRLKKRALSGSPLSNARSIVAPRQLACGLASDSRTLGEAHERWARKSAHHLLAAPLLIRRLVQWEREFGWMIELPTRSPGGNAYRGENCGKDRDGGESRAVTRAS